MRLYTTTNAAQVDDPEFGTFKAGPHGEFDFPDALSARLHSVHVGKKRQWESDDERVKRISEEELDSVRDPATLLAAVKSIGTGQNALVAALLKMLNVDPTAVVAPPAQPAPALPADQAPDETEIVDQEPGEDAGAVDQAPTQQALAVDGEKAAAKKTAAAKK